MFFTQLNTELWVVILSDIILYFCAARRLKDQLSDSISEIWNRIQSQWPLNLLLLSRHVNSQWCFEAGPPSTTLSRYRVNIVWLLGCAPNQQPQAVESMLVWRWAIVCDAGPTLYNIDSTSGVCWVGTFTRISQFFYNRVVSEQYFTHLGPANTTRWNKDVLMLAQRLRRWPNIETSLFQRVGFAGGLLHVRGHKTGLDTWRRISPWNLMPYNRAWKLTHVPSLHIPARPCQPWDMPAIWHGSFPWDTGFCGHWTNPAKCWDNV